MTKLDTARKLAMDHFRVEPNLKRIFILNAGDSDPETPIGLLEVVDGTLERGLEAISFAPDPGRGLTYPSLIIEISPAEFNKYKRRSKIVLGNRHWTIGEEVSRKESTNVTHAN